MDRMIVRTDSVRMHVGRQHQCTIALNDLGTVGKNFEAVGEVVMQVASKDTETSAMKNFRGSLSKIRIYNRYR